MGKGPCSLQPYLSKPLSSVKIVVLASHQQMS